MVTVVSIQLITTFVMPFLYNGAYQLDILLYYYISILLLSICDVIVSQKTVQWRMKVAFLWEGQQICCVKTVRFFIRK